MWWSLLWRWLRLRVSLFLVDYLDERSNLFMAGINKHLKYVLTQKHSLTHTHIPAQHALAQRHTPTHSCAIGTELWDTFTRRKRAAKKKKTKISVLRTDNNQTTHTTTAAASTTNTQKSDAQSSMTLGHRHLGWLRFQLMEFVHHFFGLHFNGTNGIPISNEFLSPKKHLKSKLTRKVLGICKPILGIC